MKLQQFLLHPLAPHLGKRYSFALVPRLTDSLLHHVLVKSFSFYFFACTWAIWPKFFLQPRILNSLAFCILCAFFFLFGSMPLRSTRFGARKILLQRLMKYFSVISIILHEYILKLRTTFYLIRIQVIIACKHKQELLPEFLPFDGCAVFTLRMPEEVSCIEIRMSNTANCSFDLLEFMINSYIHSIEFGLEVSKTSPRFSILS